MTRDARGERGLSHGSFASASSSEEPGYLFTNPKSWIPRDWQSPLNRAPTLWTAVWVANRKLAMAMSTNWLAELILLGGCMTIIARNELPTVWCIHSHEALAWGFFAVVGWPVIPCCCSICWNGKPMNSPPCSYTQCLGIGYRDDQVFLNWSATCAEVLLSILTNSARLVTKSMTVRARNSTSTLLMFNFHGPIKSTATSQITESRDWVVSVSQEFQHILILLKATLMLLCPNRRAMTHSSREHCEFAWCLL